MGAVSHAADFGFLGGHLQEHGVVLVVVPLADVAECLCRCLPIEVDDGGGLHYLGLTESPTLDIVLLKELLSTLLD